eukprot:CAMPEP_0170553962 /NCGR_PEP_ID=MMETSP0211-20121228/11814_1 /TAXON_ID=311385 /ORGANISM="Pseudokeronopsis sp., Strain OXSARD2" /LENGTH=44 /DNA_ID= /DNA_START= /DNA_END= /DNA_ORIENTATION=
MTKKDRLGIQDSLLFKGIELDEDDSNVASKKSGDLKPLLKAKAP